MRRINVRAERRVEKELLGEMTSVPGQKGIFLKMVNAVLDYGPFNTRCLRSGRLGQVAWHWRTSCG